ncbi:hypothetical protein R3P38DRAFT_3227558 [Favolaschia claudopus]|uniref:Uncharacterized protein n=2 Tax=Favolaschia claudopus TaxID=2862362 RepID=A0AAV9ZSK3_9AGAR
MTSAAASLRLSLLWDIDLGSSHLDKYAYFSLEEYITSKRMRFSPPASLNRGLRTEADVAKGLIEEYIESKSVPLKTSAIMGLGLAYARSHREDLLELIIPRLG